MENLAAYSGWVGNQNIGDEAICKAVQRLLPNLEFSQYEYTERRDIVIYGGGTIFPSVVSRNSVYSDRAFTAAIGVGARNPSFWNQQFSKFDLGYFTGITVNKNQGRLPIIDNPLYRLTKFFDSYWSYNKTLTYKDFEAVRKADIDYLGVRGPDTSNRFRQFGIKHEIVGDTALILEPSSYKSEDTHRIAVTLRDNSYYGWSTNDYHDSVVEFCQQNADDYEFVFMPFWPPDIEVCMNAAGQVPGATFRDFCSRVNVQATLDEIAKCDLVIGDKLHANVLGACAYTPFVSLEYRPKNLDFAKSVGMDKFSKRTDTIDTTWLQDRLEQIKNSDEHKDRMKTQVDTYRNSLRDFAQRIDNHIKEYEF